MKNNRISQLLAESLAENQKALKYAGENIDGANDVLVVRTINNKAAYYKKTNGSNGTEEYLGHDKREEIERLERKNYLRKLSKTAKLNIDAIEKINKLLNKVENLDEVFWKIPEEKKNLIQPYHEELDEVYIKKWSRGSEKGRELERDVSYKLSNGICVRSKSEVIIAERLIAAGVPFFYEPIITIDHVEQWLPDYYVLNKRTKQSFIWEHFGMMDNPEYSSNACGKISAYARNDFLLGKDLIISMESAKHPLDTEYVDEIIKKFLL